MEPIWAKHILFKTNGLTPPPIFCGYFVLKSFFDVKLGIWVVLGSCDLDLIWKGGIRIFSNHENPHQQTCRKQSRLRESSSTPQTLFLTGAGQTKLTSSNDSAGKWLHSSGNLSKWIQMAMIWNTWRIIPVSKWLVSPIYRPFSQFGRGITLLRGLTNHGY